MLLGGLLSTVVIECSMSSSSNRSFLQPGRSHCLLRSDKDRKIGMPRSVHSSAGLIISS